MRVFSALLLSLFAFGCHDYVVEPPPPQVQPLGDDLDVITLKGPALVSEGEFPSYQAQTHPEAVRYRFQLSASLGPVLKSVDTNDDRFFKAQVIGVGLTNMRVIAYDINGDAVATSQRVIESR